MTSHHDLDLICFSHLRWQFVYQRPQHLMSRFASSSRVFFFEEPVTEEVADPYVRTTICPHSGVIILTPTLSPTHVAQTNRTLRDLLSSVITHHNIKDFVAWYYTPTAMEFTGDIDARATVYDCMDELSAFALAPPAMKHNEEALLQQADLVFTGGISLYRAKRDRHADVHLFPSSIDVAHFATARRTHREPDDQAPIGRPRIGYSGVIDERMDLELLSQCSSLRPDWHFVLLGPIVKIDRASLPHASNLHYLGLKPYGSLPAYLSGWEIGMLPFSLNESTRFISPTKTPEYLAAGLRVISTPIADVVATYGESGLVTVISTPGDFISAAESLLLEGTPNVFEQNVKQTLELTSWDQTWREMRRLVSKTLSAKVAEVVEGVGHV